MPGLYLNRRIEFVSQNPKLSNTTKSSMKSQILTHSNNWTKVSSVGSGLRNLGNTCFMNSSLQCLTYCPPLYNAIKEHNTSDCKVQNCFLCLWAFHLSKVFEKNHSMISPNYILSKLKLIAKHFRIGRQEDAHEFIRYFIDSFQKSCLNYKEKQPRSVIESTLIYSIFGAKIASKVVCQNCSFNSTTIDPILDLSLEIKNCDSITRALQQFTRQETLSDKYKCEKCSVSTQAKKQITIHSPPSVLMIHLKRFDFMGKKITKKIQYPEQLDLSPFLTVPAHCKYELFGVLVHTGHSVHSGHYYSFVKNSNKIWYMMDDEEVKQVGMKAVLDQYAYILYYKRVDQDSNRPIQNGMNGILNGNLPTKHDESFKSTKNIPTPPESPLIKNNKDEILKILHPEKPNKKSIEKPINSKHIKSNIQLPFIEIKSAAGSHAGLKSKNLKTNLETANPIIIKVPDEHIKSDKSIINNQIIPFNSSETDGIKKYVNNHTNPTPEIKMNSERANQMIPTKEINPVNSLFNTNIESWENPNSAFIEKRNQILAPKNKLKRPDQWDLEYDRGRVKKIKRGNWKIRSLT